MAATSSSTVVVRDNPAASRFEAEADGVVAVADYRLDHNIITFTHVGVPPQIERRGIGTRLVEAALAAARQRGWQVIPRCPFFVAYMRAHPEVQDLLAPAARTLLDK
jgi:predicted GNAT family acetyltransferase